MVPQNNPLSRQPKSHRTNVLVGAQAVALIVLLGGWRPVLADDAARNRTGRDPSGTAGARYTLMGIGDSLTHGTMDGTNNSINTLHAYLQRISESLGQAVPLTFSQPLFDDRQQRTRPFRVPTNVAVDGADSFTVEGLQYYKRVGADETVPDDAYLCDALLPRRLETKYDKVMYPINLIARAPVSQIDAAIALTHRYAPADGPDRAIVILWAGNNDSSSAALGSGGENPSYVPIPLEQVDPELNRDFRFLAQVAVERGILSTDAYTFDKIRRHLTDLSDFAVQYTHLLDRLRTESTFAGGNVELFLLTLPYYSAVGYLMDSEDLEFYFRKLNPNYAVPPTFARVAPPGEPITDAMRGDRISLLTFGFMYSLLHTGYSVEYVNQVLEMNGVQRDDMVLSDAEQAYIRDRIDGFNAVIRTFGTSAPEHVHVVDTGQLLNDALTGRVLVQVGPLVFSRKWTRGGAFSLDGVHPGYTGQAFVASYVLGAINAALGLKAPALNLEEILATDPYVDRDGDGWAAGPDYRASGITEILFFLRDADDSNPDVQVQLPPDLWDQISNAMLEEVLGVPSIGRLAAELGVAPVTEPQP